MAIGAQLAALKRGQVDGVVLSASQGYGLEKTGDGRLLRTAASRGIRGIGYEINPLLVLISRLVCWRYRRLITIHLADFWRVQLPPADAIISVMS